MSELQGLQLSHEEFAKRDTEILAIVVDEREQNAHVVKDLELSYRILSDPKLSAIDAYGLRHEDAAPEGPIARPASYLLDEQGIIRWKNLSENYRYRPRPETILAEIDKLRAPSVHGSSSP